MLSQLTIAKATNSETALDQEQLYAVGLTHVQQLSRRIWTDYNVHDPGITTLELLCYALTDLSYRASFHVKDLLASATDNADNMKKQFFTARQILPNRALTLLDYRKLLIDLPGVKNAWLNPAELSYYADTVEGKLFGPAIMYADQIINLPSFAARMKLPGDAVSKFISGQSLQTTQQALAAYSGSGDDARLRTALVGELNTLIRGDSIYDPQRFATVTLSAAAQALLQQQPEGEAVVRLNRLLLEDVYPTELEKNQELRDRASLPGIVETKIRGLYDVIIEYMDVISDEEKTQAMNAVKQRLHANRNLCEDFVSFAEIETQSFLLCCELELAPDADVAKVEAEILFKFQQYLAPSVANYTLSEMLVRKKADGTSFMVDEIFDGPALDCGFIDDDELVQSDLRTKIYLSDVISIIMDIEGVRAVKDIVINPEGTSIPLADKWIVPVAARKKALLDQKQSRLVFYKRTMPVTADSARVTEYYAELAETARAKAETAVAYDFEIPLGIYRQPPSYYSFQNHFPALYGLSESGLNSATDDKRKALAYQLKAYFLFFDQIIANYFAQLSHVKELLSAGPELQRTYFSQVVNSFSNYEEIYRSAFSPDDFVDLPSFAAKLSSSTDKVSLFLKDHFSTGTKQLVTEYTGADPQSQPLKEALANELNALIRSSPVSKTAPIYDVDRFAGVHFSEETQRVLPQNPKSEMLVWLNRLLLNDTYPREIARYDVEDKNTFADRRNRFLDHLIARFAERFTDFAHITYAAFGSTQQDMINIKCDFLGNYPALSSERSLAYNYSLKTDAELWNTKNVSGLERRLAKLLGLRNATRRNLSDGTDGMYLIEMILLRPEQNTVPFLPICPDPNCTDCAEEDPYSYRIHVILPAYSSRFRNMEFRRFVEEVIREETPAHILPRICWIAKEDSALLSTTNLSDFNGLLTKLSSNSTDPVSAYLWSQVPSAIQTQLLDSSISLDSRKATLVSALNNILRGGAIYDVPRFSGVTLSAETLALQAQNPTGTELVWLNRMLLDDAYPQEIDKSSKEDMTVLEKAYRDWINLKAGAETAQRTAKLKAFIEILFAVRNVYPPQQLHECDSGEDQPKFLLGQTALGTRKDET